MQGHQTKKHSTGAPYLESPLDVCCFMTGKGISIRDYPFEVVYIICLDRNNCLKGFFELGRGTETCVSASTFDAIPAAALCSSRRVILVHSHPGCSPKPSFSDWRFTLNFARAFRCCGITLLDHVIIGDRWCCSLARLLHPRLRLALFWQFKQMLAQGMDGADMYKARRPQVKNK